MRFRRGITIGLLMVLAGFAFSVASGSQSQTVKAAEYAEIMYPKDSTIVGGLILVHVGTSEPVARVDLYVDNVVVASDSTAPYELPWDTTTAGNYPTVWARAYTSAGTTFSSSSVTVARSSTPPTPLVIGATFFIDGTSRKTGPDGSYISAFATEAEQGFSYLLVSGKNNCKTNLKPINMAIKYSGTERIISRTSGYLWRGSGTYDICFYNVDRGREGSVITGPATFTIL